MIIINKPSNDNGSPAELSTLGSARGSARAISSPSRRHRRWWVLLAIPVVAGGLMVSVAGAHGFGGAGGGGPGEGRMGGFMHERMDKVLTAAGATDAQKTQIKAVWEPLRPQLRTLHTQEADLRHQIGEAIAAATIDPTHIELLRKQSVQTMDKISALMTQGMIGSAQVLTPEQRKAVLQKMEEHRGHGPGHGPGSGPGNGPGEGN